MAIEIRLLTPSDGALLDAASHAFGTQSASGSRFLAQPAAIVFIALEQSEIVGWAWGFREVRPDGQAQVLLCELETSAPWRGQGVGTALVQAVLGLAVVEASRGFGLVTNRSNTPAVALSRRLGGQPRQGDDVVYRWELP